MAITLKLSSDIPGQAAFKTVLSGEGFWAKDGNDYLSSSEAFKTVLDGSYWTIPSGLSGGKGDDSYTVGYNDFAVVADAGFGTDSLRVYRSLEQATWSARIDGRHLAALFQAFSGSTYLTTLFIVDAFKPEGSIEKTTFDNNVILDTSYNKLYALAASSGAPFEDLSWEQAMAKKYLNLGVIGVSNDTTGANELMDLIYKTGNPITEAGVHRFFNPLRGVHFYSNDLNEVNNVRSRLGN